MKAYTMSTDILAQAAGAETISSIAHDLRSPMSCAAGAAQLALMESRRGKDVQERLKSILVAIETMDRLLDQACTGEASKSVSAQGLAMELRAVIGARAAKKGQTLTVDLTALEGVHLDPACAAIGRVLLNLAGNAVKYTQEGGLIDVVGRMEGRAAVFVVRDNGMGMKREFMRRMFEPCARAKESAYLPGQGLGLATARRLVAQMGGTICVKSAWGRGTEFAVRVPAADAATH